MQPVRLFSLMLFVFAITLTAQLPMHFEVQGGAAEDQFGHGASGIGDVDLDGFDDIAVGGRFNDDAGIDAGRIDVFSGKTGLLLYQVFGDLPGDNLGFVVAGLGDIDGDGRADWAAGAPRADHMGLINCGAVKVISGIDGTLIRNHYGPSSGAEFGTGLAGGHDVDGDGTNDLVVGAVFADGLQVVSGEARVFSGDDGAQLHYFPGLTTGSGFGFGVALLADLNADNRAEIVVGAPIDGVAGEVRIYSGIDGSFFRGHSGSIAGDQLGRSVADAGDIDGDGTGDLIVGAMKADPNGDSSGQVRVFSGLSGLQLYQFDGESNSDQLGWSVAGVGDVNGDGRADVAAGARFGDRNGSDSGYIRVWSGFDGAVLATFDGTFPGDNMGWSVSAAGDVNGDKFDDVLAGARYADITGTDAGQARVFGIGGARKYGDDPLGTQDIAMDWHSGIAGDAAMGAVIISGATPFTTGIGALSLGPDVSVLGGMEILVDLTTNSFLTTELNYDVNGEIFLPINLRQPAIAGSLIYLQAIAPSPAGPFGLVSSNGLEMIFTR